MSIYKEFEFKHPGQLVDMELEPVLVEKRLGDLRMTRCTYPAGQLLISINLRDINFLPNDNQYGKSECRRMHSGGASMTDTGYLIAQIDVKDYQAYMDEYGVPVSEIFTRVGAEVLVATPSAEVLEGEWCGNWTVVVKFPSCEAARLFYDSADYAPLKQARIENLSNDGNVIIVSGLNV